MKWKPGNPGKGAVRAAQCASGQDRAAGDVTGLLPMTVESSGVPGISSARAWSLVALLSVAYLFSLLDRTILSLLIGPIQKDLGISDTQFGFLQGLTFAIFYLLAGLPIGGLVDRTSRIRLIGLGIALWSAMTMASGFASRFSQLFLARIGVAVGEATLNPAAYSLLSDLFPQHKLGRAMAVFISGSVLGTGLAYAFGGGLISLLGARPEVSVPLIGTLRIWQVALLAAGAPGLLLAVWMLMLPEPPRPQRSTRAAETSFAALRLFLRQRRLVVLLHFGAFSCLVMLASAILTWGPALLFRTHGLSAGVVGMAMGTATGVCGILGFFSGGALADHWLRCGQPDAHMKVGLWAAVAALPVGLLVALSSNTVLTVLALCLLMFLLMAPVPAGVAGLQLITPPLLRGRVSAIYMVVTNLLGIGLGPMLPALFTDYVFRSQSAVNLSLAIFALIVTPLAIAAFFIIRDRFGAYVAASVRPALESTGDAVAQLGS